jgi:UDP-N-acetylmuramyl pentapeptide phosphotransferase/UDP-N-acetylglucosamine-1-phosphate transferase
VTPLALLVLAGAAAAVCAGALVPFTRWANARQIVAVPNERSSHSRITPVGGGAPLAVCVVGAAAVLGWRHGSPLEAWAPAYVAGALAIVAVSWLDDLRGVGVWVRLTAHVFAAVVVVQGLASGIPGGAVVGGAIAVFWIVGVTNAYNFMDGIDGMAGTQALVAGAAWAIAGAQAGYPLAAALGGVVAGASAGFLLHNWAPARIFMGDVGSALLGYTFAAMTVQALPSTPVLGVAGALALWPFVFDATFTLLRRLSRGENVLDAHRSHLYQRLVRGGWSHATVTTIYGLLAACGVVLGEIAVTRGLAASRAFVLGSLGVMCAGLWLLTRVVERRGAAGAAGAPRTGS